jgi:hypothetical protein
MKKKLDNGAHHAQVLCVEKTKKINSGMENVDRSGALVQ